MPSSTALCLVNWIFAYSTICTRFPHGSLNSTPRPGKVAILVGRLSATFGDVNELVSQIDEGYLRTAPTQREFEQPAIEGQRFLYVPDLEGHVVDTDEPCLVARLLDRCHVSRLRSGTEH